MVTSFTLVWIKIEQKDGIFCLKCVTSFTLVWIKMPKNGILIVLPPVTSFTLVWIKMLYLMALGPLGLSHELHARVD